MKDLKLFSRFRKWNHIRLQKRKSLAIENINYPFRLGVLGIMKNESMNIIEWIEHYIEEGSGQIYLIDNGSTDDTVSKIQKYIQEGIVHLIELPQQHKQKQHYWTAIEYFKILKNCQWLIIADLDEFWFCKDGEKLSEAIKDYQQHYDVIYVNWSIFGSGGNVTHPKSIRKELTMRHQFLSSNIVTKYICKTSVLKSIENLEIHKIRGACSSATISDNQKFQINHYVTQSIEYFEVKMKRGDVIKKLNDKIRDMDYFYKYDEPCIVEDFLLSDRINN